MEKITPDERHWLTGNWTRWLLAAAAMSIVAEAVPTFVLGAGLGAEGHAARHLATWQIGFGVGLLVAAWMSRMTHAMLALAGTFAALTVAATVFDVVTGHRGPWTESIHLIELVAVVLLWRMTPAHLFWWQRDGEPRDLVERTPSVGTPLRVVVPKPALGPELEDPPLV